MIYEPGAHLHLAHSEHHFGQLFNVDPSGKCAHRHREKWRFHRLSQNFTETSIDTVVTHYTDFIFLVICQGKEGQSLDVVPMSVRDQQRELDWLRAEFLFQSNAEGPDTGTGIKHDDLAVCADFYAGRVATIPQCSRTRYRDRAARPPKLESCGRC